MVIWILLFRLGLVTLSKRVKDPTHGVAAVGALSPLGYKVKLGLVRGKYLPACFHAAEASHVSVSSLASLRAAIGRAAWSSKMPMTSTSAILILLDGLSGVDPALYVILGQVKHGA